MNSLLILIISLILSGLADGGASPLTEEEELEVLTLFRKVCSHNENYDYDYQPRLSDGTWVHCKTAPTGPPITTFRNVQVDAPAPKPFTVFINQPPVRHKTNLVLKEQGMQDVQIYVLPSKDQHLVDVKSNFEYKERKPVVYFVPGNEINGGEKDFLSFPKYKSDSSLSSEIFGVKSIELFTSHQVKPNYNFNTHQIRSEI